MWIVLNLKCQSLMDVQKYKVGLDLAFYVALIVILKEY